MRFDVKWATAQLRGAKLLFDMNKVEEFSSQMSACIDSILESMILKQKL